MSSDDDEDELLQIALQEQSQRDLNYQKPSSNSGKPSKPVQNFVQQPPANKRNPPARKPDPAASPMPRNKQRQSVDYDDDSEVEMLSISSGDEDSSKDRGLGSKKRPPKGSRDDDKEWDGEEPDCWKRVDESEVCNSDYIYIYICIIVVM